MKMTMTTLALAAALAAADARPVAAAAPVAPAAPTAAPAKARAVAALEPRSGSSAKGKARFFVKDGKATMEIEMEGLTPGEHAIHLHDKGDCSAPDAMSAGGHWNPTAEDHGKWGQEPHHHGDIGNLVAGADGKAKLRFATELWAIGGAASNDVVGRSVIVHAGVDDFKTQPTGNAGGRVACGVIVAE